MTIERGCYNNAEIAINLVDGTDGQLEIFIRFKKSDKFLDVDDNKIKEICNFPCNKDESNESLKWTCGLEGDYFVISWSFRFSILDYSKIVQRYQLLDSIFNIIKKINCADLRVEIPVKDDHELGRIS